MGRGVERGLGRFAPHLSMYEPTYGNFSSLYELLGRLTYGHLSNPHK